MYTSLLHFRFHVNSKLIHNPTRKKAWRRGTGPGGVKHKIKKVIHRYRYKVENQTHLRDLIKPYLFGLFIWLISNSYLTSLFFAPYFNITCLSLPYYILQGLIYYYTLTGQNTKKIPPAFTRGGFDDDERTVGVAPTTYILAYFLTKFKFYFHFIYHPKNSIMLFIFTFFSIIFFILLFSCAAYI